MALKKIPGVRVEPLIFDTYLAMVRASVGSPLFRTFWCSVNGVRTDVVRGGRLSCAFFVTSILKLFNLVSDVQITNNRAAADLRASGWVTIPRARTGCVVTWAEHDADPRRMRRDAGVYQPRVKHIGFYIGKQRAVSNGGDESQAPYEHALTYRPVEAYWWHPLFDATPRTMGKPPRRAPGIYWQPNR